MVNVPPVTTATTVYPSSPDPFLYEWTVEGDTHSGISMTPHGAMDALSATLLTLGAGRGFVRPVELVHDDKDWAYQRWLPVHRAECRDGIIQWR